MNPIGAAPAAGAGRPDMHDDCSDLAALDAGDPDAGRRLYDRHAAVLVALCREETGTRSREDAEDAVQETFLRAFRMRSRLTDCTGFRPWLYAIARLVCRERRKSRARERRDVAYALDESRQSSKEGPRRMATSAGMPIAARQGGPAPSAALERGETLERLGRAIDALPDDVRLALHLFYLERDPVEAAKRSLGVSRAQFYRLVATARELIGAKLSREDLLS